jgi:hypothetical protein
MKFPGETRGGLGLRADANKIRRIGDKLRNLWRQVESLRLEGYAQFDISARLFHHVGKHDLAHRLRDDVVGRVSERGRAMGRLFSFSARMTWVNR